MPGLHHAPDGRAGTKLVAVRPIRDVVDNDPVDGEAELEGASEHARRRSARRGRVTTRVDRDDLWANGRRPIDTVERSHDDRTARRPAQARHVVRSARGGLGRPPVRHRHDAQRWRRLSPAVGNADEHHERPSASSTDVKSSARR